MEIETVKRWIDRGREIKSPMHLRAFWDALDALEGMSWHRANNETVAFILENVRESKARDAVVKKLETILAKTRMP